MSQQGLQPHDVGTIAAAAGDPKGLKVGPLDRYIFGHWLALSSQTVHLVVASIGAWRMATACLNNPVSAFERLERDYIAQHYDLQPGENRPSAHRLSRLFADNLQSFYGVRVAQALAHPRYRLHITNGVMRPQATWNAWCCWQRIQNGSKLLPNRKLPDRGDFTHYGADLVGRMKAWQTAKAAAQKLADEFGQWVQHPAMARVKSL